MAKKTIITIAGKLGSGKSSTAKRVSEILGYEHLSTGDFMRKLAEERGLSLNELNIIAEKDLSIDHEIDDYCKSIEDKEKAVVDSRLGFYFIPRSFKVFLELSPEIAAGRILKDSEVNPNRHKETTKGFNTPDKVIKSITERLDSERKRYREMYGINDHTDHENFDLVIDTATMPLPDVSKKIVKEYKEWLNK